ncbi:ABC transporter permease [Frankia sp. CNm7]|uniref:ABC transporter permease n=1 Tax=Frankia nepalensis TaxID=1836974 RepID=A0A937RD01_9ACTN|nr:hypothetical protein [Frankia nepalensis]MBL7501749.1 ABC transporter permease [Frankia nepalensis]MBL7513542.1 ABC transporter permease [Frankia nepalensis]MBL7524898.1 ABC transporter permease [Frankia nepalensis]MBL7628175.1 hypothetical protein [Frankia nepalensis]
MTASRNVAGTGVPQARHGFRQAVGMEWVKLASLRSTWWVLALTVIGAVTVAVAVARGSRDQAGDVTNNLLAGVAPGLLVTGVLGVLTMTSEYTSGLIRSTLAAVPRRPLLLAAKATVLGGAALVAGELAAFVAFTAGVTALPARIPAPSLADPAVLRAVLLAGSGYCLIGLMGLGLGAVLRHTGAAVAAMVGGVYVVAQFVGAAVRPFVGYVPVAIVGDSLTVTRPVPPALGPWAGLGMLCLYAAVLLGAGGWLLARRPA